VRLTEETEHPAGGARVTHVVDDSPAAEAGIREDDIIVEFDGNTIRGPVALTKQIRAREAGDEVTIKVVRDGKAQEVGAVLGSRVMELVHVPQWDREGDEWQVWQDNVREQVEGLGRRLGRSYSFSLPEGSREMSFGINWGRPKLGVQLVETTPELREHLGGGEDEGVLVSMVLAGTPAARAGIAVGDLIISVDGDPVAAVDELRAALDDKEGKTFVVQVIRDHRRLSLEVTITEPEDFRPTGPQASLRGPAPRVVPPPHPPTPTVRPIAPAPPAIRKPPAPPGRAAIEV
jgi:serine protease Do